MRTLAIETATEACSIALFEGKKLIANRNEVFGRGHAEKLIPMIGELPGRGKAARVLVSLGPGSFIGVRIGIAAARALGLAWGAEVQGYPTLGLVAAMARQKNETVLACMNGGHGEWFVQQFDVEGLPEKPASSFPPAEVAFSGNVVAGNRAAEFSAMHGFAGRVVDILPDASRAPDLPEELITRRLSPIYGRAPDAKPKSLPG